MPVELAQQDDFFSYVEALNDGSLHCRFDEKTGLKAIIAIDSTLRGPALGGCRCLPYPNTLDAVHDVIRLAKGMTYKAAVMDLDFGGGKAVILAPATIADRTAFFAAFGDFVNELGGRYITAIDSGSSLADIDAAATRTPYAASVSNVQGFPTANPSPLTALGVYHGIKAAVKNKLGQESLSGLQANVQGLGNVGFALCQLLHNDGVKLTVTDTNTRTMKQVATQLGAKTCAADEIFSLAGDLFVPCALGAVLNDQTIPQLQTAIVAGAANNQLATPKHGEWLHERGVLYAPDYVINAAGLIYATEQYQRSSEEIAKEKIGRIYNTLLTVFQRSAAENKATNAVADELAEEKLASP